MFLRPLFQLLYLDGLFAVVGALTFIVDGFHYASCGGPSRNFSRRQPPDVGRACRRSATVPRRANSAGLRYTLGATLLHRAADANIPQGSSESRILLAPTADYVLREPRIATGVEHDFFDVEIIETAIKHFHKTLLFL